MTVEQNRKEFIYIMRKKLQRAGVSGKTDTASSIICLKFDREPDCGLRNAFGGHYADCKEIWRQFCC